MQPEKSGEIGDYLTEERIGRALNTRWLGHHVHVYHELDSTNHVLSKLAEDGAAHGTMVLSDFQSQGRGRGERRWLAPPGTSLLMSLLFRVHWPARQAGWLTMAAGLAATYAVEKETTLRTGLKWPNDLMLATGDGWAKMGGILLETQLSGDRVTQAILGIGLNVNIPAEQLPAAETAATSLLAASGHRTSRLALLASLLLYLELLYEHAAAGNSPRADWNEQLITLGHPVTVGGSGEQIKGVATGTDDWGRLLVRDDDGRTHTVAAGDVTLRGTPLPDVDD